MIFIGNFPVCNSERSEESHSTEEGSLKFIQGKIKLLCNYVWAEKLIYCIFLNFFKIIVTTELCHEN